jgi:hypothetical protein
MDIRPCSNKGNIVFIESMQCYTRCEMVIEGHIPEDEQNGHDEL